MKYSFGDILKNKSFVEERVVNKAELPDYITTLDELFVVKNNKTWCAYDRVCDHNGGQLNLDPNGLTATCPIHKWTFNFLEESYENGCKKKPLKVIDNGGSLSIFLEKNKFPEIQTIGLVESVINFYFNAHASVSVEVDGLKLITDPWLIGSCFVNGWWHAYPPSDESIDRLKSADFIYISHNHPDHLHIPTLKNYVSKDTKILCPNFESRSVETILRSQGFHNLVICDFMREIKLSTSSGEIKIVIVKSGDDRDDSALLLCTKNKKIFFAVDANMPNNWVLPDVDVLFTPFAGGASGFPSRVENFSKFKKIEIIANNRASMLNNHVKKLVSSTNPNYVVPYAGYFCEINRDSDVSEINKKNTPEELINFVEMHFKNIDGINPIDFPLFSLESTGMAVKNSQENPAYFLDDQYVKDTLEQTSSFSIDLNEDELLSLGASFINSQFVENLTVVFLPMDNLIKESVGLGLVLDFSENKRSFKIKNFNGQSDLAIISELRLFTNNNLEILRVRSTSFAMAIRMGLPLEDLSIGFQVKMFRDPNVYNFKFWDYFTNKYFCSLNN